jgi:pilus assembly protein CpaB
MKRRRVFVVLALAVLSGLVAAFSALRYMQQRPTRIIAQQPESTQQVVIAAIDLPVGHVVKAEDVRTIDWPGDGVPVGFAQSIEEVTDRGLITPLRANEPVLETKLAAKGIGGGLPVMIPEGMRAISIGVDEVIGVAGFVTPGTRVDVLLTVTPQGAREPVTQVILQNVEALAAGQIIQRDEQGTPISVTVLTVLVTPEQAEELAMSATQGRIQLALRNYLDLEEVDTPGTRISSIVNGSRPAPTRRVIRGNTEDPGGIIEFYRAGVRTLISY